MSDWIEELSRRGKTLMIYPKNQRCAMSNMVSKPLDSALTMLWPRCRHLAPQTCRRVSPTVWQVQDKAGIFNRFRSVDESIIVAISSFEMRIDVSDIRIVFHIDRLRNLLDYAQKSERARRNELISETIIVLRENVVVENQNRDSKLMKSFVQSEVCKRQVLNDYLDKHVRIECEENEQSCEYCAKSINVSSIQNQEFELTKKNDFDSANDSYLLK